MSETGDSKIANNVPKRQGREREREKETDAMCVWGVKEAGKVCVTERERETVEAALCTYNFRRDWVDKRECARTKEGDP